MKKPTGLFIHAGFYLYVSSYFFLLPQNPPLSQNPFSEQPIQENPAAMHRSNPIDSQALNAVGPLQPVLNKQFKIVSRVAGSKERVNASLQPVQSRALIQITGRRLSVFNNISL